MRASTARAFQAHRLSLNSVRSLKYLGHIIMSLDDDWPELVGNLVESKSVGLWELD